MSYSETAWVSSSSRPSQERQAPAAHLMGEGGLGWRVPQGAARLLHQPALPFNSGHVSLSLNALHQLAGVSDELRQLRLRYPGMDVHGLGHLGLHIGTRIRGPHWLTFLGPPVLGELGGVLGLRSRLTSPDISVQPLDGERALVTLGEWPEAGDTTRGLTLPLHRELARVLEPWLYHEPPLRDPVAALDTLRWERRFLD